MINRDMNGNQINLEEREAEQDVQPADILERMNRDEQDLFRDLPAQAQHLSEHALLV
jgi:hypothetical protein